MVHKEISTKYPSTKFNIIASNVNHLLAAGFYHLWRKQKQIKDKVSNFFKAWRQQKYMMNKIFWKTLLWYCFVHDKASHILSNTMSKEVHFSKSGKASYLSLKCVSLSTCPFCLWNSTPRNTVFSITASKTQGLAFVQNSM